MFGTEVMAVSAFSVFVQPWSEEFGWSRSAISAGASFGTVMAALVAPFAGRWTDRYGARRILTGAVLLIALALAGLGFLQSLLMFFIFYALGRSIMMGASGLSGTTAIANWFDRRRALAMAMAITGQRIGTGFWPVLASALFLVVGWRGALWVMAAMVASLSLLPVLLIIGRRPEEVGLSMEGRPVASTEVPVGVVGGAPAEVAWTVREAVRTRSLWFLLGANMAMATAGGGLGLHRVPYFQERGLDVAQGGLLVAAFAMGMALGGFFAAILASWIPHRYVLALLLASGVGMMAVLINVPVNALAFVYVAGEGMMMGGFFTIAPVTYAVYFGRRSLGSIRGLVQPGVVAANAAGLLFAGVVYDLAGGRYQPAFAAFAVLFALGAVLALLAVPPRKNETVVEAA
jgi:MFS family permease